MKFKKGVVIVSDHDYEIACSKIRHPNSLCRVSTYAVEQDPNIYDGTIILGVDGTGKGDISLSFALSPPAAKQIAKSLNNAVKDYLNGRKTESS